MTEKVFLSYASQDRAFAQALKGRLAELLPAQTQPIDVFDQQLDLAPGGDMRKALKNALDAAGTVVIVSSPAADRSEWVNYEAGLADALGKDVIIVGRKGGGRSALSRPFSDRATIIEMDDVN